jgi:hypothetical protein
MKVPDLSDKNLKVGMSQSDRLSALRQKKSRPALRQKNAEEGSSGPQGIPFHTDLKRGWSLDRSPDQSNLGGG